MANVNVKLNGMKVSSFSPKEGTVLLEISFNDGTDKEIYRNTRISDPKQTAEEIIKEIIQLERNIKQEFDGKNVDGEAVTVNIAEEEENKKKIAQMLYTVESNIQALKNKKSADGYMEIVTEITRTELRLE